MQYFNKEKRVCWSISRVQALHIFELLFMYSNGLQDTFAFKLKTMKLKLNRMKMEQSTGSWVSVHSHHLFAHWPTLQLMSNL